MNSRQLFTMALGLTSPWQITESKFETTKDDEKELHLYIDFERGSKFSIGEEVDRPVHDTIQKTWRHLDFFQHKCYLHCRVPRVRIESGKVKQVNVPWARPGSGFTLLFEAYALQLVEMEMPVNKVGATIKENPDRIWTIITHYVGKAYQAMDHSQVSQIGIDETSVKKGHQYITTAIDLKERRLLHAVPGKSKESVQKVGEYLESKGCSVNHIEEVCIDLSPAFIAGTLEVFPEAAITFDRFHVKKILNEAMNKVRIAERKEHDLLKGHKYTFLKSQSKLSEKKIKERDELLKLYPTLGEAYRLKVLFDDFWDFDDEADAVAFLNDWNRQAEASGIQPFIKFTQTVKSHWYGIISYIKSKISNGILEGTNTKIQLAKRRARGFRKIENFIAIIYLTCAKLDFQYPHKTS